MVKTESIFCLAEKLYIWGEIVCRKEAINIRKRKDGRYEGRYGDGYKPDGSIRYRSVYGKTYGEAKQKLYAAAGGTLQKNAKPVSKFLFEDVCAMWLKSKRLSVKVSTISRYKTIVEKHLCSAVFRAAHFTDHRTVSAKLC